MKSVKVPEVETFGEDMARRARLSCLFACRLCRRGRSGALRS